MDRYVLGILALESSGVYKPAQWWEQDIPSNARVWRYMSLARYLSLLHSRSLWFSRFDVFDDKFEGSFVQDLIRRHDQRTLPDPDPGLSEPWEDYARAQLGDAQLQSLATIQQQMMYVGINCWFLGRSESAAMWRLYSTAGQGVALRTTVKRLQDSFRISPDPDVFVGRVIYAKRAELPFINSAFSALRYKKPWYDYEKEVRVMCFDPELKSNPQPTARTGWKVEIDVERLVEAVIIHPDATSDAEEIVREVTRRFEYPEAVVRWSEISPRATP